MKKLKKFIEDYRETGEAETSIDISYWHLIIIAALIALVIYICNS